MGFIPAVEISSLAQEEIDFLDAEQPIHIFISP